MLGFATHGTAAADAVLVGAGDIANCPRGPAERSMAAATADLLETIDGTVFAVGDLAYPDGSAAKFRDCYDPTWGRFKARTRPTPGNHDYVSEGAAPYYAYFGASAGPGRRGYYSYKLGDWHIVSLNSEAPSEAGPQEQWLRADLAAHHDARCTLAYWHRPAFSSDSSGDSPAMRDLWHVLYQFGVSVVVNAHHHHYERFAPQDPDGHADARHGIREFVVGTGGAPVRRFSGVVHPNSEVRNDTTYGVLKLTLHATSYDWVFVPIVGQTFRDTGHGECVARSPRSDQRQQRGDDRRAVPGTIRTAPRTPVGIPVTVPQGTKDW